MMELNGGDGDGVAIPTDGDGDVKKRSEVCPRCHKEFEHLSLHTMFCSKKHVLTTCRRCDATFDSEDVLSQHDVTCKQTHVGDAFSELDAARAVQFHRKPASTNEDPGSSQPMGDVLAKPDPSDTAENPSDDVAAFAKIAAFASSRTMNPPYMCSVCDAVFTEKSHLSQHSLSHRLPSSPIKGRNPADPEEEAPPYGEIVFPPTYSSSRGFDMRVALKDPKTHQCKVCGEKFRQREELRSHVADAHSPSRLTQHFPEEWMPRCDECGQLFARNTDLARHMTFHDQAKMRLEERKRSNSGASAKQNETVVKQNETSAVATSAASRPEYDADPASPPPDGAEEKNFRCERCYKSYKRKSSYVMHMRSHEQQRGHRCTQCGKNFFDKDNLLKHLTTHTKERPYQCDLCPKSFTQKPVLVEHRRIHTGEKPFKCDDCGKAFSAKVNLTKHIRIHTGEKPFECEVCFKAFTQKSSLWTHKRTHNV